MYDYMDILIAAEQKQHGTTRAPLTLKEIEAKANKAVERRKQNGDKT